MQDFSAWKSWHLHDSAVSRITPFTSCCGAAQSKFWLWPRGGFFGVGVRARF